MFVGLVHSVMYGIIVKIRKEYKKNIKQEKYMSVYFENI